MHKVRRTVTAAAALAALALGGSALAGAATNSATTTTPNASSGSGPGTPGGQPPAGGAKRDPSRGGHMANGKTETLLTGDTATKVKEAALARVSGGTLERVETDADHGSPYEAHIKKADGTEVEVLVNSDFQVTAVNAMQR